MDIDRNEWWSAADWGKFDNEQRRKTILWCEEHLGKHFSTDCDLQEYGLRVGRNRYLSKLGDFSSSNLGFHTERLMQTLVCILGCWNPIWFRLARIEVMPLEGQWFPSINGRVYKTWQECAEADKSFREMFPALCGMIGDERLQEMRKQVALSGMATYKVHLPLKQLSTSQSGVETYNDENTALRRARQMSNMHFRMLFGGGADAELSNYCDLSNVDYTKENCIGVPKIKQIKRIWGGFQCSSYFKRISNPEQDDEFIDFLRTL